MGKIRKLINRFYSKYRLDTDVSASRRLRPSRYLIDPDEIENICDVGMEGRKIISKTAFTSQSEFNVRRGKRIANILNDYFRHENFSNKKIIELGPGHYAFALLARYLGAEVICIEKDPAFIELGRYLGFKVIDMDFNSLTPKNCQGPFDGMWIKGTFNACNYKHDSDVENFVARLTSLVKPEGWAWLTVVNKSTKAGDTDSFINRRIELQRQYLQNYGWMAYRIEDEERSRYALNYTGSPYLYYKNLPAYDYAKSPVIESKSSIIESGCIDKNLSCSDLESSQDKIEQDSVAFNKVQRIWKPTFEYYPNPWRYFVKFINISKQRGVRFITMSQALSGNYNPNEINVLLDHHIDFYPIETEVMCRWELNNDVISNVYLFNRFIYSDTVQKRNWTIEDINIPFYQELENNGFEIGYHQNALGLVRNSKQGRTYSKYITEEDKIAAQKIFAEDIDNLRKYFNIRTFIPHGAGEGNAQLTDLPPGYEDVVWVYNNAKRNGTREPPLKWRNYSDSCGAAAQRIKGYKAQYVTQVDNLHLNAYLLEPGLNHVLIHPGRFSKGMPYELFDNKYSNIDGIHVGYEFSGISEELPLRVSSLLQDWLHKHSKASAIESRLPLYNERYYLFSDDMSVLQHHMAQTDYVTPIHVIHRRITVDEKDLFRVPRPIATSFHLPQVDEEFSIAFRKFYNSVFTDDIFYHLAKSGLPLDAIHLSHAILYKTSQIDSVKSLLNKIDEHSYIYMSVTCQDIPERIMNNLLNYISSQALKKIFSAKISKSADSTKLIINSVDVSAN